MVSEVTILISNVLKSAGCWIDYLHIAGKIFLTVNFAENIEGLISNVYDIKLMIAWQDSAALCCGHMRW